MRDAHGRSTGSSSPFVLGLSTRKVGETVLALLGRSVSPSTVSQVAKTLDAAVAAFHRRPLQNRYKALMLDGVVLYRKTGAGALRRPVLVALGLRHGGKKEIIDFRLAASESAAEWEKFLADLYRRGLAGEGLDMICVDGGCGLLAGQGGDNHRPNPSRRPALPSRLQRPSVDS
jgi:putative transposase